jgi:hypothetical protein
VAGNYVGHYHIVLLSYCLIGFFINNAIRPPGYRSGTGKTLAGLFYLHPGLGISMSGFVTCRLLVASLLGAVSAPVVIPAPVEFQWATGVQATNIPSSGCGDVFQGRGLVAASEPNTFISMGSFSGTATFGSTTLVGDKDVYVMKSNSSGFVHWVVQVNGTYDLGGAHIPRIRPTPESAGDHFPIASDGVGGVCVTGVTRGDPASFGSITLTGLSAK